MAVVLTDPFWQFFDSNGDPLSEGYIDTFAAGTTTRKATYTTEEATVENANPIVLDSAGRPPSGIFIQGSYRFDLYDSDGTLIKTVDNVTSFTTLNESGDPFFQSFSGDASQTVFTLSESLGNDSKDIMVFVNDESGDVGYNVQNPSAYTLSGTALTFSSAPPSGTNNVYVFAPTKLLGAAAAAADLAEAAETGALAAQAAAEAAQTAAETAETNAETAETNAADSAAAAALSAAKLQGTSTTSVAIGTGSKSFTTQADKFFGEGVWLLITSDADEANYMHGQVTSYSGTSLTVGVTNVGGSGTLADWTIRVSGTRGAVGATGATGPAGAGLAAVVDDTTPQLGGNLDVNGNAIVSVSNGDIEITPNGTGSVVLDGLSYPQADGTDGQVLTTDGAGNIAFEDVGGGGLVHIKTIDLVADSEAIFDDGVDGVVIDGTYKTYIAVLHNITATSSTGAIRFRDSGSDVSGANYDIYTQTNRTDTGTSSATNANQNKVGTFQFSGGAEPSLSYVWIQGLGVTCKPSLRGYAGKNFGSVLSGAEVYAVYKVDVTADGIKFYDTGNITGSISLYGLAEA